MREAPNLRLRVCVSNPPASSGIRRYLGRRRVAPYHRRRREMPINTGHLLGPAWWVGLVATPLKIEVSAVRVRLSPSAITPVKVWAGDAHLPASCTPARWRGYWPLPIREQRGHGWSARLARWHQKRLWARLAHQGDAAARCARSPPRRDPESSAPREPRPRSSSQDLKAPSVATVQTRTWAIRRCTPTRICLPRAELLSSSSSSTASSRIAASICSTLRIDAPRAGLRRCPTRCAEAHTERSARGAARYLPDLGEHVCQLAPGAWAHPNCRHSRNTSLPLVQAQDLSSTVCVEAQVEDACAVGEGAGL